MLSKVTLASAVLLAVASAHEHTIHNITALENPYRFEPDMLEGVEEGDEIRVTFSDSHNHNILAGSWEEPCVYNSDVGVNSGVHGSGEIFAFWVNSTDPQLYFCSVGSHCQAGMVLAVNPSGDNTLEAYTTEAADATTDAPNEEGPVGGMLVENDEAELPHADEEEEADSAANGLRTSVAMAAAVVAGAVAFVI